jgi:DNA-binding CsgD family transcriptional regulator
MQHLTRADHRALFNCLGELYSHHQPDSLTKSLLCTLPQIVPADVTGLGVIDPRSKSIVHHSSPSGVTLPETTEFQTMFFRDHPTMRFVAHTGYQLALKISDFLSQAQWRETALYREAFRQIGVEFNIGCQMAGPDSEILLTLALNRVARDFSETDRLKLNLLRPHIRRAYENAVRLDGLRKQASLANEALAAAGRAVIAVSAKGAVLLCTAAAHSCLAGYFDRPPRRSDRLPEQLRHWMRQQELPAGKSGKLPPPPKPYVIERHGKQLTVHLLAAETTGHRILLLEEHYTAPCAEPLEKRLGLTARRAEVLLWVTQGKTSPEIAMILGLSTSTVNKHLEHIFAHLGVETRTAAALCATEALNQNTPPSGTAPAF